MLLLSNAISAVELYKPANVLYSPLNREFFTEPSPA